MKKIDRKTKFRYSIIIPVYNADKYLDETIRSVINQTIGFKKNVQIILVDDGSTDNSIDVCKLYNSKYKKNILYIKQKNQGVSVARNKGLKAASGDYVIFLDSDDILSKDLLSESYAFFETNKDVDIVAFKIEYFDAKTGPHWINYRFNDNKIYSIEDDYQHGIFSASAVSFRLSAIKDKKFKEGLNISEDGIFTTEVVLDNGKIGLLKNPTYFYRKRHDHSSLSDSINISRQQEWFMVVPSQVYGYLINYSKEKYGFVHNYVQYYIMSQLQHRFLHKSVDSLSSKDYAIYKKQIDEILKDIDDNIIMEQKSISAEYKLYILGRKYGENSLEKIKIRNGKLLYNNNSIYNFYKKGIKIYVDDVDIDKNSLVIKGSHTGFRGNGARLNFTTNADNSKYFKVKYIKNRLDHNKISQYETIYDGNCFEIVFNNINSIKNIKPLFEVNGRQLKVEIIYKRFVGLHTNMKHSYFVERDYMVFKKNKSLQISKYSLKKHIKSELKFLYECIKSRKRFDVVFYRLVFNLIKKLKTKELWVLSDRLDEANDNSMYLFEYINSKKRDINSIFTVNRKSDSYKEIKKIGKVIGYGSFFSYIYFLLSDKIISSQSRDACYRPFAPDSELFYSDIMRQKKYIFLSHGVHQGDTSKWLNKYLKRYNLLTVSSDREKDSFMGSEYGYKKNEVAVTGLPRYDTFYRLNKEHKKCNIILLSPTWRKELAGKEIDRLDHREYNSNFKKSDYFVFYNSLLNDSRIIKKMKQYDYKLVFLPHPNVGSNIVDFNISEGVEVSDFPHDYKSNLSKASAMITDYSSVGFDFAYLNKPVIYTQFDKEYFNRKHGWTFSYFDFEKDGFGPVTNDYESAVKCIVRLIENNCKLDSKYRKRIEDFFYKIDDRNSHRVYESILNMNK